MRRIGLQARVLMLALAGIAAATLIVLATQMFLQIRAAEQDAREQTGGIGAALLPTLRNDLVVGDLATVQQTLDSVQRHTRFKRLALLDALTEKVLVEGWRPINGAENEDVPRWFEWLVDFRADPLTLDIEAGGTIYARLRIEPSSAVLLRELWQQMWLSFSLALVALVLVLPLFILTLRSGLRPLRDLAASAKKFGAGDYSRRAPDSQIREVSIAARAFNRMAGNIQALMGQLHASNNVNRRLAMIVEQSGEIIMTLDTAGHITSWNPGAAANLGYAAEEVVGQPIARLQPGISESESEQMANLIARAQSGERHEIRLRAKSGRLLDIALGLAPQLDDSGRRCGLICIGRDYTERKQAQDEVRRLNQELEQRVWERTAELEAANHELEAFSYTVSHDLRAPLRALDGFSRLVEEEVGHLVSEQGRHFLQRIRAAGQKMSSLIENLLDLSRIGRQELSRSDVPLSSMAEDIRSELEEEAPERSVVWHIEPDLVARADPVLMRALLDNLLRNAWKFTAERQDARIELSAGRSGGETVYSIRDNGAGFEMAYADKLFKPFQRLHDAKRFEGTGIGLAIVHRILQRHGGRAWAESQPGQGATFHFTLP